MGCESSKKEKMDLKIIEESSGLINQAQLDNIYMSYNFTQNEMLTIIDEFKKLCKNPNGLITPENLMDFPPFHYSPFGYHILDALDLNDTDSLEKDKDKNKKDENLKIKEKEKEKDKKKSKDKSKKDKKDKTGEKKGEDTNEDLISDIPEMNEGIENADGSIGVQDFAYYVYLFSSHSKVLERAQLYFRLFDFDNDGKITPSDLIVYLENLENDSDKVLKETKKYFNKERKINKDDYILELDKFKSAKTNRQIANLIIKEACSKDKNYMDFFDFRNMFLSTQFIPEYSTPLYLEEKFNDGRVGGGAIKKKEADKDVNKKEDSINQNETQEVVIPVKTDIIKDSKDKKKDDEKTAQDSKNKKNKKENEKKEDKKEDKKEKKEEEDKKEDKKEKKEKEEKEDNKLKLASEDEEEDEEEEEEDD